MSSYWEQPPSNFLSSQTVDCHMTNPPPHQLHDTWIREKQTVILLCDVIVHILSNIITHTHTHNTVHTNNGAHIHIYELTYMITGFLFLFLTSYLS